MPGPRRILLVAEPPRSLFGVQSVSDQDSTRAKNQLAARRSPSCADSTIAGCADQTDMEQLNQNQFALRGMIASDRQQIDALKDQVAGRTIRSRSLQHNTDDDAPVRIRPQRSRLPSSRPT